MDQQCHVHMALLWYMEVWMGMRLLYDVETLNPCTGFHCRTLMTVRWLFHYGLRMLVMNHGAHVWTSSQKVVVTDSTNNKLHIYNGNGQEKNTIHWNSGYATVSQLEGFIMTDFDGAGHIIIVLRIIVYPRLKLGQLQNRFCMKGVTFFKLLF